MSVAIDADVVLRMLRDIYEERLDTTHEVAPEVFDAVWSEFSKAVAEGYGVRTAQEPRFDFYQALRRSTAVFSAFKVHRMQNDMAARMIDENGRLKPFRRWVEDVASIADHQVGSWLRTEYDTAVKRAHMAADWQQFEAEEDVFPNLEWLPSTSVEPRPEHMVFYGLVLPIRHPFWREHFPGDLWGCKCGLQATDAPRTPESEIPATLPNARPAEGLEDNPAHTAEIFGPTHPYYTEAYEGADEAVKALMDDIFPDYAEVRVEPRHAADYTARIKELRQLAKPMRGMTLRNEEFGHDISFNMRGIKEYLNQPHEHYVHKNDMILKMPEIIRKAKYMGATDNFKGKNRILRSHLFEIRILGDKSWIIVQEMDNGEMLFYGISDSPRILTYVKK